MHEEPVEHLLEGEPSHSREIWTVEIATWDKRRLLMDFTTDNEARTYAERFLRIQREMIDAVDSAAKVGGNVRVED